MTCQGPVVSGCLLGCMDCYPRRNSLFTEYVKKKRKRSIPNALSDVHVPDEATCGVPDVHTGDPCTSMDFYPKENRLVCNRCGRGRERLVDAFSGFYDRESSVHYLKPGKIVQMWNSQQAAASPSPTVEDVKTAHQLSNSHQRLVTLHKEYQSRAQSIGFLTAPTKRPVVELPQPPAPMSLTPRPSPTSVAALASKRRTVIKATTAAPPRPPTPAATRFIQRAYSGNARLAHLHLTRSLRGRGVVATSPRPASSKKTSSKKRKTGESAATKEKKAKRDVLQEACFRSDRWPMLSYDAQGQWTELGSWKARTQVLVTAIDSTHETDILICAFVAALEHGVPTVFPDFCIRCFDPVMDASKQWGKTRWGAVMASITSRNVELKIPVSDLQERLAERILRESVQCRCAPCVKGNVAVPAECVERWQLGCREMLRASAKAGPLGAITRNHKFFVREYAVRAMAAAGAILADENATSTHRFELAPTFYALIGGLPDSIVRPERDLFAAYLAE